MLKGLAQDKNGFYLINDGFFYQYGQIKLSGPNTSDYVYKRLRRGFLCFDHLFIDGVLAENNPILLSEVILSKVANMLDVKTAEYHLVRNEEAVGVVCPNIYSLYPDSVALDDYISDQRGVVPCPDLCLKDLKKNSLFTPLSLETTADLEKIAYVSVLIGNLDNHEGNIFIDHNGAYMIDYENNSIVRKYSNNIDDMIDSLRSWYKSDYVSTRMGIEGSNERLNNRGYFHHLATSEYVNPDIVYECLDNLVCLLHNDNFIHRVNAELVEEYGMEAPDTFMQGLKCVMEITGEKMDKAVGARDYGV